MLWFCVVHDQNSVNNMIVTQRIGPAARSYFYNHSRTNLVPCCYSKKTLCIIKYKIFCSSLVYYLDTSTT